MQESAHCFHHLEWPTPGRRVRGPLLFLRGWAVAKPGCALVDVRARLAGRTFLGVYGLPRVDLAAHFNAKQNWLPAEFVVAVPVTDGASTIVVEAMDLHGQWLPLAELTCMVAPDGESDPQTGGEFQPTPAWLSRSPHVPFHGHLDEPDPEHHHGRTTIFGWLLHTEQPIKHVFASTDLLGFSHLEHGLADDSLAAKVPTLAQAHRARLRGAVDAPATLIAPSCLRVYAQLADGSIHLCFARRFTNKAASSRKNIFPPRRKILTLASLPALPSGRPRRLLLGTLNLHPDDATRRALDVGRHLVSTYRWAVRLVTTVDGPLRTAFEEAGIPVQIVNPQSLFSAAGKADTDAALTSLGRQIWWRHLDATVVFAPVCDWLLTLAAREGIPGFSDWSSSGRTDSAPSPLPHFNSVGAWHSSELPTASREEARRALGVVGPTQIAVFPLGAAPEHGARLALQATAWLALIAPTAAAQWKFVVLDGRGSAAAVALRKNAELAQAANFVVLDEADPRWLVAADVVCGVGDDAATARQLLDATALGTPLIVTSSEEIGVGRTIVAVVSSNNPLALASELVAHLANPAAAARRARAAQQQVRETHAPQLRWARWQATLESALAAAR